MKKISIVLWVILLVTGCSVSDNKNPNKKTTQDPIEKANDVVIVSDVDSTVGITPDHIADATDDENTEQDLTNQTRSDTSEETKQSTETETETIPETTPPVVENKIYTVGFQDKIPYPWTYTKQSYFSVMPLKYDAQNQKYMFVRKDGSQDYDRDKVGGKLHDIWPYKAHSIPKYGESPMQITFDEGITHVAIVRSDWTVTGGSNQIPYVWSLDKKSTFYVTGNWYGYLIRTE